MDSNSDAVNIQPCSSKSSTTNHHKIADDAVVIIDNDDSMDSAYETGSAVSRSTQSSPTRKHFCFCLFCFVLFECDIKPQRTYHTRMLVHILI